MQEISAILGLVFGSCLCLFFFFWLDLIFPFLSFSVFLLYFVVVVVVCGQIVRRMVMRIHGYRHTLELALEQSVLLHGSGRAQRWPGNGTGHTLQWNVPHFSYGRSLSLSLVPRLMPPRETKTWKAQLSIWHRKPIVVRLCFVAGARCKERGARHLIISANRCDL